MAGRDPGMVGSPGKREAEVQVRVAIVHYWLVTMRGGERVLDALLDLYPEADVFTHVADPAAISPRIAGRLKGTTFIGRIPGARRLYQKLLPLMPLALERLDLSGYDLVISSEGGPTKGVLAPAEALHVCYCHSPMRYAWVMPESYLAELPAPLRPLAAWLLHRLRIWDVSTVPRVDHFIANSATVGRRIRRYWGRDSVVVHPPVELDRFAIHPDGPGDAYLFASQLVGYKRADVAVRAFAGSGRKLLVAGEGPELEALKRAATPNVTFLGRVSDTDLERLYARCRALVFCAEEDFGIVPLEAMACGRPVIAFGRGGARETVVDGVTGLFFDAQTAESLRAALDRFETAEDRFDPAAIRRHAEGFGRDRFGREVSRLIEGWLAARRPCRDAAAGAQ